MGSELPKANNFRFIGILLSILSTVCCTLVFAAGPSARAGNCAMGAEPVTRYGVLLSDSDRGWGGKLKSKARRQAEREFILPYGEVHAVKDKYGFTLERGNFGELDGFWYLVLLPTGEIYPLPQNIGIAQLQVPISAVVFAMFKAGRISTIQEGLLEQYAYSYLKSDRKSWRLVLHELMKRGLQPKDFETIDQVVVTNPFNSDTVTLPVGEQSLSEIMEQFKRIWKLPSVAAFVDEAGPLMVIDGSDPSGSHKVTTELLQDVYQHP